MNIENIPKLMSKEDPYHIHKMLGILSLGHFAFRYYHLMYQSMHFDTDYDISLLSIHFYCLQPVFNLKSHLLEIV